MATADDIRRLQEAHRQLQAERAARQEAEPAEPDAGQPPPMTVGDPDRTVSPRTVAHATTVLRGMQPQPEGRSPSQENAQTFADTQRGLESGILPGEEQVTSQDTFRQLTADEQAALRRKYETGGHAETMKWEDWLADNFGDDPPDARLQMMRGSATSTPRLSIGRDESLKPGENSPLARSRLAAGKPLPEGREPHQYSPQQRRTMQRNVHNPEVPMTPFGGTFTLNEDGAMSSRAPAPQSMQEAAAIAKDQGEFSPSHVIALAQAYGIDAQQYGDDIDMLRADVMREKERHDRLATKYDIKPTPMGATRYAANPQKMSEARAAREAQATPERRLELAQTLLTRYGRLLTPEDRAAIQEYVKTPDGFTKLRELNQMKRIELADKGAQAWRDRQANFRMTTDLNNPRYAPGFYLRSLIDAARNGDPVMLSTVNDIAGNPMGAQRAMDLAMAERAGAAQLAQSEMAARNKPGDDQKPLGQQLSTEFASALSISDPSLQREAVRTIIARNPANQNLAPADVDARAREIIATHFARSNPSHPAVQEHLRSLMANKPAFVKFAEESLGLTADQANQLHSQAAGGGWRGFGQAIGNALGLLAPGAPIAIGAKIGAEMGAGMSRPSR
jgi:hypothetical protein